MDLFSQATDMPDTTMAPLADRMRPRSLAELVGQTHIVGEGKVLRRAIERDELRSLIFWGPPGTGKTSLAWIIAAHTGANFVAFSAVTSGIKEVREVIKQAEDARKFYGRKTILFVDEIHRFNKAQQDAFLPHVETGTIILIGATTENPSFEVNSALLSRSQVFVLHRLTEEDIRSLLERALLDRERGLGQWPAEVDAEALTHLARMADGDARTALNALELAVLTTPPDEDGVRRVTLAIAEDAMQQKALLYDRAGEEHFNLISALHKSMRGSDPDATLYWLARMLESGEDPLYIARRIVRFATEDVGLADPHGLTLAMAARDAMHFIGRPEGDLALAQAAVYLACAPKSNALYRAYEEALADAREKGSLPVPLHLRNAPTELMKNLGYGQGYKYAHDYEDGFVEQTHLPEALQGKHYYQPTDRGREAQIAERLAAWRQRLQAASEEG